MSVQRDVLGAKLTSGRRVLDQEVRAKKQEEAQNDRLDRLERMVRSQSEKLDRLETLVYKVAGAPASHSSPELRNVPSAGGLSKASTHSTLFDQAEDDSRAEQLRFRTYAEGRIHNIPTLS
jgi:hypothetical protein